jgi:ADP-ribose pyrophosphatase YjhB (NUDIX family)
MALAEFTVAGALVESADGLLLVRNRRRGGTTDWSTPGGVIDATDPTLRDGLAREVFEETGLRVLSWEGPLYEVRATARELGWSMRCEVHRALAFDGELRIEDPDGIVIEACFAAAGSHDEFLAECSPWVREPLRDWIEQRWGAHEPRRYTYDVLGATRGELQVVRTSQS